MLIKKSHILTSCTCTFTHSDMWT